MREVKTYMLHNCFQQELMEAGVDEAGRGCFAGPVAAAAVILRRDFHHPLLTDSKKLTAEERNLLRPIIENAAICWRVAMVFPEVIDRINILQATYEAMHLAIRQLNPLPEFLNVDGKWFRPFEGIKHTCCIGGDANYANIAAASILAKTHRDAFMENLHTEYPHYNWKCNKGYGTPEHRLAMENFGLTEHHRRSFQFHPKQGEIFELAD